MSGTKEFIVRVTATDIKKGKRFQHRSCALALAISRELGVRVSVNDDDFDGHDSEGDFKGVLSHDACEFRSNFDQSKHDVRPQSFCLSMRRKTGGAQ